MLAKTFEIIAANWWFYVFFGVLLLVIGGIVDAGYVKSGSGVGNTVVWLIFARFVHRAALFGVKFGAPNPDGTVDRSYGGFILKGLALLFISMLLAFPVLIWSMGAKVTAAAEPTLGDIYLFAITFLIVYSILLSLAGSWLPATVYRRNTSLGAALKRSKGNFLSVLVRIGPTLLLAIIVELAAFIVFSMFHFDLSIVRNGAINPPGALVMFLVALIEAVSITLISVILSHYYLLAEGISDDA